MQMNQPTNRATNLRAQGLKALAVLGFIAILIFGAWGLIQVARMLPGVMSAISSAAVSLSSIFVPAERLEIAMASANVQSGEPFTISWTHEGKRGEGSYTLSFDCRDGLSMEAPGQNGVYQKVFCNTPFNLTNEQTAMKLIAISNQSRFLDVPMKLTYTRLSDGKTTAQTETAITVINDKATGIAPATTTPSATTGTTGTVGSTATTPRPGTQTRNTYVVTNAGRVSDPNGRVDLAVAILDTGTIDPITNVYTKTSVIRKSDRAAVRFTVENLGTKTTDRWSFNAVLPTHPMLIYSSDMQAALGPGDKIEYTMGFDKVDGLATQNTLTLNVDPANTIWNEVSENNNIAKVILTITN